MLIQEDFSSSVTLQKQFDLIIFLSNYQVAASIGNKVSIYKIVNQNLEFLPNTDGEIELDSEVIHMHYTSSILYLKTKNQNLYFYNMEDHSLFKESLAKVCMLENVQYFTAITNFLITVNNQCIRKWYLAFNQT